jgi:cytoskeleton protein RodZ
MKKTGDLLKKVREEKGLSLHEIGLSLKINPKILKQIEDGEKDNLPAKTFLRGFVQSYANFLKLDSDEVLRIFSEEMGSTKPQQIPTGSVTNDPKTALMTISESREDGAPVSAKPNANTYNKKDFEFKNFGIGALVILLLLSLIGVRKIVEKYQKESEIEPPKISQQEDSNSANPIPTADMNASQTPDNPMVVNQQPTAATQAQPMTTPSTLPTTSGVSHPQPMATTAPTTTPTTVATTKPVTTPVVSTTTPTSTPHPTPTVAAITKPATSPTNSASTAKPTTTPVLATPAPTPTPTVAATTKPEEPKKPKNVEVVIQALDSVDVEVTLSSGKSEVIKLSPSQTQTIKSQSGVKLNFSNGGAVNLIVNGKDMGVPGDLGKPKKVSF